MRLAQRGSTGKLLVNFIYDFAELGRGKEISKTKLATIQKKRLAPLAIEKLRRLGPRLLDDLSLSNFWKMAKYCFV